MKKAYFRIGFLSAIETENTVYYYLIIPKQTPKANN
ncbi:hypothetical protein AE020_00584 [Listeria monocytogenes]|nr:hypothetical protein AE020_00584 [Listeria monocytogenes]